MDPLTVSAQFAAYLWFNDQKKSADVCRTEAMQFAHAHWKEFLPLAHQGVGRLLLRLAKAPREPWRIPSEPVPAASGSRTPKRGSRTAPVMARRFSMN
jgi:hypothetical protein